MLFGPFIAFTCEFLLFSVSDVVFTRRVSWGEWDAPDHLCSSSWSYQGCWMCWWMLRRCPQIGSKQELMGSTLLQVGSVHCFSLNFYDITVSYTQLHVYIYKHKFQKHTNLDSFYSSISGYKHTKQLSIFCTVHWKCFNFTSFLWVYKRQFASYIIILVVG